MDKPIGLGSTQAVGAVKRVLRDIGILKKLRDGPKVGHGGTLDPLASGVLPIAIGEATKLTGRLLDASKIYDFTISFGAQTDGLDAEGEIVARSDKRPNLNEIEAILPQFIGEIEQVPPAFSAIKIDGKRAYDLARGGQVVEMKPRAVTIYELFLAHPPVDSFSPLESITLTAHVSKGTYIRSLARDIALAAGTVGHVSMLRRTKAGPFSIDQAISLDKWNEISEGTSLKAVLLPLEAGLADIPVLCLTPDQADFASHGGRLNGFLESDGIYLAKLGDTPVALMELEAGEARVSRGFNF